MRWIVLALAAFAAVADAAPKRKPGAVVVVIDRSGSMQGPKLEAAKAAALATLDALAPDDQIAIVAFDSEAM
jgi:Ca-activated chloride channel family protein